MDIDETSPFKDTPQADKNKRTQEQKNIIACSFFISITSQMFLQVHIFKCLNIWGIDVVTHFQESSSWCEKNQVEMTCLGVLWYEWRPPFRDRSCVEKKQKETHPFIGVMEAVFVYLDNERSDEMSMWQKVRQWLARPSSVLWMMGLAILLTAPSFTADLVVDDHIQRLRVLGIDNHYGMQRGELDLFSFITPSNRERAFAHGTYPWWSAPKLQLAFWRPLSSATHVLDYRLWPNTPFLMHLHSSLWLALLVFLAFLLYRRFLSPLWVAGLATLFYAIDEAHGLPVTFLANRNALIATCFAILVLLFFDRWRRDGWEVGKWFAPVVFAVGLLAGEYTIFVTAYLFAYVIFLERGSLMKRLWLLVPYGVVVVLWRLLYKSLQFGAFDSEAYIDPLTFPLHFLGSVLERLPILLLAQWSFISSDFWMTSPQAWNNIHAVVAVFLLGIVLYFIVPVLRRDATARFWGLGMLIAGLPICATFPHDRLLFGVGLGAMGLIAQVIGYRWSHLDTEDAENTATPRHPLGLRIVCMCLLIFHGVLAPMFLPLKAIAPRFLGVYEKRAYDSIPKSPDLPSKQVVLVQTPLFLTYSLSSYFPEKGTPLPKYMNHLAITAEPMKVTRLDPYTLAVYTKEGLVDRSSSYLLRAQRIKYKVGTIIKRPGIMVTYKQLSKTNGRPSLVHFRFNKRLEDPSMIWLIWKDDKLIPFTPPKLGETKLLPKLSLSKTFL
ncbi:MAG: hypothetical protein CL920_33675 [Deltaproteobacteria bacterium]|nr:hypothetical protein [Deltaproteobacteria bacterium]